MTLFIGGPWDGKRRDIEPQRLTYDIAVRTIPVFAPVDDFVKVVTQQIRYRREHMFSVGVFVLEGLTMAEVFHKLMDGYKP